VITFNTCELSTVHDDRQVDVAIARNEPDTVNPLTVVVENVLAAVQLLENRAPDAVNEVHVGYDGIAYWHGKNRHQLLRQLIKFGVKLGIQVEGTDRFRDVNVFAVVVHHQFALDRKVGLRVDPQRHLGLAFFA